LAAIDAGYRTYRPPPPPACAAPCTVVPVKVAELPRAVVRCTLPPSPVEAFDAVIVLVSMTREEDAEANTCTCTWTGVEASARGGATDRRRGRIVATRHTHLDGATVSSSCITAGGQLEQRHRSSTVDGQCSTWREDEVHMKQQQHVGQPPGRGVEFGLIS
jgi:hypothetical protein